MTHFLVVQVSNTSNGKFNLLKKVKIKGGLKRSKFGSRFIAPKHGFHD
jgi:hypothetical protein